MQVLSVRSDGCLSYLLVENGEAAVVDPGREIGKYLLLLGERAAKARWVIDTHTHADHLSGARRLADQTGARLVMSAGHEAQWRAAEGQADALGIGNVLRANAGVRVDQTVKDGDTLALAGAELRFLEAPGHTLDSLVLLSGERAFTGDTLLIGQTGRCDLPGGDPGRLHDTLFRRLAPLPDETFVYPGHDYQGQTVTALGYERAASRFLRPRSRDEFAAFLGQAFPTLTGAGMQCGAAQSAPAGAAGATSPADPLRDEVARFMDAHFFGARHSDDLVAPADLAGELEGTGAPFLLDVREPAEFGAERIPAAFNLSVHQLDQRLAELPVGRDVPIVAICRSGKRSGWAAMFLRVAGYRAVRSLDGGMLAWARAGLPVQSGSES